MSVDTPVSIQVFADYLCPWCYVAAHRLRLIQEEYGDAVLVSWRSYPLRDGSGVSGWGQKSNQGRLRAVVEESGIKMRLWPEGHPMPSTSFPALEAAKCARLQGAEAFARFHWLLFCAYFVDCADISRREVLADLANRAALDVDRFLADLDKGTQHDRVLADHHEFAEKYTGWGVPTAVFGQDIILAGAVPVQMYARAIAAARRALR